MVPGWNERPRLHGTYGVLMWCSYKKRKFLSIIDNRYGDLLAFRFQETDLFFGFKTLKCAQSFVPGRWEKVTIHNTTTVELMMIMFMLKK